VTTDDLFKGKKVALFGVPGAFTPTCSAKHLPGFVQHAEALKAKGVNAIVCTSVNDVFVMNAWGKDQNCGDKVMMLADGDAAFTKATGLELDLTGKGLGLRNQRFSMLVEDGVVKVLNIDPSGFDKTSAETLLSQI
jgi:peroxiredoxin (alkyl hydroperoxide reductase subunit C)